MNKLILCEGETDAILLSYYLRKVAGWEFCRKGPKNLEIRKRNGNESINWYRKEEDYLLICGVGGKDNFGNFFDTRIKMPLVTVNAFEKIAIVTDRDDRMVDEISQLLLVSMDEFFTDIQDRVWSSNSYQDAFGMEKTIELLLVVIPREHLGALETVMLDAISEDPYDKNIVDKAGVFVQQMRTEAGKYIWSDRLQLKAHLGITWAIQSPEKVFSMIDEQINNVQWEKYEVLRECFGELSEI
jgi:hypothetical protein